MNGVDRLANIGKLLAEIKIHCRFRRGVAELGLDPREIDSRSAHKGSKGVPQAVRMDLFQMKVPSSRFHRPFIQFIDRTLD